MTSPRRCRPGRLGRGQPGPRHHRLVLVRRQPGRSHPQRPGPRRRPRPRPLASTAGPVRQLRPPGTPSLGPRPAPARALHGRGPGALHRPSRPGTSTGPGAVSRRHPPRRLADRARLRLHRLAAPTRAPRRPEPPAPPPAPARPSAASTQAPRQPGPPALPPACGASTGCASDPGAPPSGTAGASSRAGASVSGIRPPRRPPTPRPAGTACASTGRR